tara:strand:- start:9500 stop:10696 length:1197 start_codon:yes stop_codon:yes gene_type:complete
MKKIIVSYSDKFGGAAKSAYRIFQCLRKYDNSLEMIVVKKISNDKNITAPLKKTEIFFVKIKNYLCILLSKFFSQNPVSFNIFNSSLLKYINKENYSFINLHWINAETLSVSDISNIKRPVILTLHDMWYFTGIENYILDKSKYWKYNEKVENNKKISNFFLEKKLSKWKNLHIITPSNWMKEEAKKSKLMSDFKIEVIPYPINLEIYKPNTFLEKNFNKSYRILFSAFGRLQEKRKGFDLLVQSLNMLSKTNIDFTLVTIGSNLKNNLEYNFKIENLGFIEKDEELVKIYNSVDVVTIPSRLDNLPNVGLEAHACGKPIVAYNIGGLPDIVEHNKTGFLTKPFDVEMFYQNIKNLLINQNLKNHFSKNARAKAVEEWSSEKIFQKYKKYFDEIKVYS